MNQIASHRSASEGSTAPSSDPTRHRSAPESVDSPSARTALLVIDTSTDACSVAVCLPLPDLSVGAVAPTPVTSISETFASEMTIRDDIVAGARIVACWRRTGAVSSEALLPMVQAVLDAAGIPLQSCGAIAFGAGPGSFTGVRTATGAAQGLAFANDMPVLPLDTLMACAESARLRAPSDAFPAHVYVAVDARMGECYAAAFTWCGWNESPGDGRPDGDGAMVHGAGASGKSEPTTAVDVAAVDESAAAVPPRTTGAGWRVDIDAHVVPPQSVQPTPADWTQASSEPAHTCVSGAAAGFVLAGNAVSIFGDALPLHAQAVACDDAAWPEPLALAALGWRLWRDGAALPAAMAQPRYVRDKVALTTKERLAAKEAKSASKEAGA